MNLWLAKGRFCRTFLGAFAKLQKRLSCVMSVYPSAWNI